MTTNETTPSRPLDAKEVGRRIALARELAGLKQSELAEKIGVIPRSMQNYEYGRIPYRYLDRIAEATGVTKTWILHGDPITDENAPEFDVEAAYHDLVAKLDEIVELLRENGKKADALIDFQTKRSR